MPREHAVFCGRNYATIDLFNYDMVGYWLNRIYAGQINSSQTFCDCGLFFRPFCIILKACDNVSMPTSRNFNVLTVCLVYSNFARRILRTLEFANNATVDKIHELVKRLLVDDDVIDAIIGEEHELYCDNQMGVDWRPDSSQGVGYLLFLTVLADNHYATQSLLRHGCVATVIDPFTQQTPLELAVRRNASPEMIELLARANNARIGALQP